MSTNEMYRQWIWVAIKYFFLKTHLPNFRSFLESISTPRKSALDFVTFHKGLETLRLAHDYANAFIEELETMWEPYYLPNFDLKGKTVLDVGAGCGETAFFYLRHGAKKVLCVEPNTCVLRLLRQNCTENKWDVEIIPEKFNLGILKKQSFDFMKMDGEGCERELLQLDSFEVPCVIEAHGRELAKSLSTKFGMRIVAILNQNLALLVKDSKVGQ